MRIAAYFAVGIQGFVVAALLIARQGGASLAFDMISPSAISPGAVLAATAGAALFAGLYPFVPWRYQPAQALAAAVSGAHQRRSDGDPLEPAPQLGKRQAERLALWSQLACFPSYCLGYLGGSDGVGLS